MKSSTLRRFGIRLAVAALTFCLRAAHADDTTVTIDNFTFQPAQLTVKVGTTVTWKNHDDIPHTVVANDKSFKSRVLDTGEKFSFTPTKPGAYPYFCSVHPKMTGTLVVE